MFKRSSGFSSWRLSQARRASGFQEDLNVDKGNGQAKQRASEKKSGIPRPTRASSADRELGNRQSAKAIHTAERGRCISSNFQMRSLDILKSTTPISKTVSETPASMVKFVYSARKAPLKDTRPLSEKQFQHVELMKVREYFQVRNLLDIETIKLIGCGTMTSKVFVNLMEILLKVYFPKENISLGNYMVIIPHLLKKLRYPGNVTRSLLITANAGHSWPSILGILSWLVDLLQIEPEIKWVTEEDEYFTDAQKIQKMFEFNSRRYLDYIHKGDKNLITKEDIWFFQLLYAEKKSLQTDYNENLRVEVKELEEQFNNSTETHIFDEFRRTKEKLQQLQSNKMKLEERYKNLVDTRDQLQAELAFYKTKEKQITADKEDEPNIEDETFHLNTNTDDLKSKWASLLNIRDMLLEQQNTLNNEIYTEDLAVARLRTTLDQLRLKSEAKLQECGIENVHFKEYNYLAEDAPQKMKDLLVQLNECLSTLSEEVREKKNSVFTVDVHIKQLSDKREEVEADSHKLQQELQCKEVILKEETYKFLNRRQELTVKRDEILNNITSLTVTKPDKQPWEEKLVKLEKLEEKLKADLDIAHEEGASAMQELFSQFQMYLDKCEEINEKYSL